MIKKIFFLLFWVVLSENLYATYPENEAGPSEQDERFVKPYIFRATHSSGQAVHFLPTIHDLRQSDLDPRYRDWVQRFLPDICIFEHDGHGYLSNPQFANTPPEVKELHREIAFYEDVFDKARQRGTLTFSEGPQWSFSDSTIKTRVLTYLETINFILNKYNLPKLPELDGENIFITCPAYVVWVYQNLKSKDIIGSLVWTLYQLEEYQRMEQLLGILPDPMRTKFQKSLRVLEETESSPQAVDQEEVPIDDVMDEWPNAGTTMYVETEEEVFLSGRPDTRFIETLVDDFSFFEDETLSDIAAFFASWALTTENVNKLLATRHSLLDRESLEIRNHNWARKYRSLVQQGEFRDKKVLGVHGLGHFPGEAGIINLMSQQGWCWDIYDYAQQKFVPFSDSTEKFPASASVVSHSLAQ